MTDDIETDRLGKRTALSKRDNVTFLYGESRRAMSGNVGVTLLKTTVLGDIVQVVTTDDNGSSHLGGDDDALDDGPANRYTSSEGTLLVHIVTFNGGRGCLDPETHVLHKTHGLVALVANGTLASDEDGILLLVSLLVLIALIIYLWDTGRIERHSS